MTARFPPWLVAAADGDDDERRRCAEALRAYFRRRPDGRPAFSGACFDTLGPTDPNRVESLDLVALAMLEVPVYGHAALGLMHAESDQISAMLTEIPGDVDLHVAPVDLVDHTSCAEQLWNLVRGEDRMGWTRTAKLLARKRPRLLPVYDTVVARAIGLSHPHDHWLALRALLHDAPAVVTLLNHLHTEAELPPEVSTLRTLDVLLWMRHRRA